MYPASEKQKNNSIMCVLMALCARQKSNAIQRQPLITGRCVGIVLRVWLPMRVRLRILICRSPVVVEILVRRE